MTDLVLSLLFNGFVVGCRYLVAVLFFTLVQTSIEVIHIAYGGVIVLAGCAAFITIKLGLPIWLALLMAMLSGVVLSTVMELVIYRPLRRKQASNMIVMLVSLGMLYIIQSSADLILGGLTSRLRPEMALSFSLGPLVITDAAIWTMIGATVVSISLLFLLYGTSIGRSLRALSSNRQLARSAGIDVNRLALVVFSLSGIGAGLFVILEGLDLGIRAYMGFDIALISAFATIIGGFGSLSGAALAAVLIGMAKDTFPLYFATVWQQLLLYLCIFMFMLAKPRGFFGRKVWKAEL